LEYMDLSLKNHKNFSSRLISIKFEQTLENDITGVCSIQNNGFSRIKLSRKYWNFYSDRSRRFLVFHELSHCLLGLPHNNLMLDYQCSSSIMNENLILDECTEKDYITELFK
jgi:Zn-dependent peptidase ImmA (M78 family)